MNSKDVEILQRLNKGDQKALAELYDSLWKPLFISAYNILKNKQLCEEIIQDVFIALWNNRIKLDIKISLQSYLYACVRYKVFSEFKKNKFKDVELFEELNQRFQYTTPETKIMHKELVYQIEAIITTLPKRCQEVYRLSREKQLSHKEIAESLDISPKTVENHITYALRILKTNLGNLLGLELLYLIS